MITISFLKFECNIKFISTVKTEFKCI